MILALDTATRRASVALCRAHGDEQDQRESGVAVLAEAAREVTTHSEGLLALIDGVLREAGVSVGEVDAVCCGRGPGSFTGLRIGMATAKGLCLAGGLPILGVSSLWALYAGVRHLPVAAGGTVAALLDARRGELYIALFREGAPVGEERVVTPAAAVERLRGLGPVLLCGDGALTYQDLLLGDLGHEAVLAPAGQHHVEARHLAAGAAERLARGETDDLTDLVPTYIRPTDARLPKVPQDRRVP